MLRMDGIPVCTFGVHCQNPIGALCYSLGFISGNKAIAWANKQCTEYYLCFESSSLTNFKMNKVTKTIKHKKPQSSPSSLNLSFTNIRGLRSNFSSVESYLLQSSPDLIALCETNLSSAVSSYDLSVDGYLPLIRKDSNSHMLGLGIYISKNSPICRETRFESTDYSFMCFCLAPLHSITFLFVLYRSPSSQDCTLLDVISDCIDQALILYSSANIVVVGDFNVHHTEWLGSSVSDSADIKTHNFCLSQSLTQIVNFPTRFPDNPNYLPSLLDLCLVSNPSQCSVSPHSPLGGSDHGLVSLKLLPLSSLPSESPYHCTSYNYLKADWDTFRDFLCDGPWIEIFRLPVGKCASYMTSWIQAGMEFFIPSRGFQVKPHSSLWFSSHCVAAIANRNHYFHIYQQNNSPENRRLFITARNHCKKVLSNAKACYSQIMKSRISSQKLGSRDFWRIFNSINNTGKSVISPLLYSSDFVTSPKDKAELFAKNFSSISSLDSTSCILPDIAVKQVDPLLDIRITPASVSKVISCLGFSTACGPDNIPVIVLQKCSPELSSTLSKLFNKCLSVLFSSLLESSICYPYFSKF
ncbi:uncharacterized protein LOC136094820 [Hydra vulgaris]|uniref:uncharacterized protein LOC136094820 n=1 Tax=Hydra vulgaris TaxID=6087 RepID=UPI0032E9E49E